ncbi:MAG: radical SAM protein [Desulfobacterales bacterium]|nr:radical SAM protein [Desulfobacterales bacterium]
MKNFKLPESISSELIGLTGKLSKKNLLRIVAVFEKLASINYHNQGINGVKKLIEEDHPGVEAVRRIFQQANSKARSAILNNFILGTIFLGYKKRLDFYNQHGVAPPGSLMLSPTVRCNLRCYGCYAGTHEHKEELTFDEVDRILSDAYAAGTNFIIVLGGEPFMVPWLLDVIQKHDKMAFMIYTNGLLIDDDKIKRLVEMGNAGVAIGLDGLKEETDERKGAGTFDKAMGMMRKLRDAGVIVGFSAMTSRKNFDVLHSDAFFDTMIENGAGFGWLTIAVPQGRASTETDLIPTVEQKAQIQGLIQRLKQTKPILIADFLTDTYMTEGCGAGRIMWHINANGDAEPCVLMPFAVDNIREKSFLEIIRSDFFKGIRGIHQRHCKEPQTCMMTFQPKEVLDVINQCGARETSIGTLEALNELAKKQE